MSPFNVEFIKWGHSGSVDTAMPSWALVAQWIELYQVDLSGSVDRAIPSGALVDHGYRDSNWDRRGSVDRAIPSGAAVAQWIERFQVGPQWPSGFKAVVAERLARSPPTKANRVRSPSGPRDFASGNHALRCHWSADFLGDLPFYPPLHSGGAPYSPQSSALKTSVLRAAQISSLTHLIRWHAAKRDFASPRKGILGSAGPSGAIVIGTLCHHPPPSAVPLPGVAHPPFAPHRSFRHCLPRYILPALLRECRASTTKTDSARSPSLYFLKLLASLPKPISYLGAPRKVNDFTDQISVNTTAITCQNEAVLLLVLEQASRASSIVHFVHTPGALYVSGTVCFQLCTWCTVLLKYVRLKHVALQSDVRSVAYTVDDKVLPDVNVAGSTFLLGYYKNNHDNDLGGVGIEDLTVQRHKLRRGGKLRFDFYPRSRIYPDKVIGDIITVKNWEGCDNSFSNPVSNSTRAARESQWELRISVEVGVDEKCGGQDSSGPECQSAEVHRGQRSPSCDRGYTDTVTSAEHTEERKKRHFTLGCPDFLRYLGRALGSEMSLTILCFVLVQQISEFADVAAVKIARCECEHTICAANIATDVRYSSRSDSKRGLNGSVDRAIPSGTAVGKWLERFQVGPQWASEPNTKTFVELQNVPILGLSELCSADAAGPSTDCQFTQDNETLADDSGVDPTYLFFRSGILYHFRRKKNIPNQSGKRLMEDQEQTEGGKVEPERKRRRQRTAERVPHKNSKQYFFELNGTRIRVCQVFFLKTLCITNYVILNAFKHRGESGTHIGEDKRGKHEPGNKTSHAMIADTYLKASHEERELLKENYEAHQKRKIECNSAKAFDKERALKEPQLISVSFDLRSVLQIPSSDVSATYYSRKICDYYLTVYESAAPNEAFCFRWTELNDERGSSEIGSCLFQYLTNLPHHVTEVSMFSDTCGGQNRNRNVAALMLYIVQTTHLEIIEHKFLENRHTYMEVDSMHRAIEQTKRFAKEKDGVIEFKYDHSNKYRSIYVFGKGRPPALPTQLTKLYKHLFPISKQNKKGFLHLCQTGAIPEEFLGWYNYPLLYKQTKHLVPEPSKDDITSESDSDST
ncbi:hypothetical protein PR048_010384 [Dryococelus australis]|uniref:Uncharacterized protein n=1 Tax=Dryococelus australis TaxID=614101 RepID=A0ABQ9I3P9_9NEOP|nr:hypothetical protein PR048_010384 [Dryococelus australis]